MALRPLGIPLCERMSKQHDIPVHMVVVMVTWLELWFVCQSDTSHLKLAFDDVRALLGNAGFKLKVVNLILETYRVWVTVGYLNHSGTCEVLH